MSQLLVHQSWLQPATTSLMSLGRGAGSTVGQGDRGQEISLPAAAVWGTPLVYPWGQLWEVVEPVLKVGHYLSQQFPCISSPICCFFNQDGKGWSRDVGSILPQAAPHRGASYMYHQGWSTKMDFWRKDINHKHHLSPDLHALFKVDICSGLHCLNTGS